MLIRLSVFTLATMWSVMVIFGRDLPDSAHSVLPDPSIYAEAAMPLPGTAPVDPTDVTGAEPVQIASVGPAADMLMAAQAGTNEANLTEITLTSATPAAQPASADVARTENLDLTGLSTAMSPEAGTDIVYVTGNSVNLRSGPSTARAVLGQLTLGTAAEVLDETANGWMKIRDLASGQEGYMAGWYLSAEQPI